MNIWVQKNALESLFAIFSWANIVPLLYLLIIIDPWNSQGGSSWDMGSLNARILLEHFWRAVIDERVVKKANSSWNRDVSSWDRDVSHWLLTFPLLQPPSEHQLQGNALEKLQVLYFWGYWQIVKTFFVKPSNDKSLLWDRLLRFVVTMKKM